jgi:hypothetical protein
MESPIASQKAFLYPAFGEASQSKRFCFFSGKEEVDWLPQEKIN